MSCSSLSGRSANSGWVRCSSILHCGHRFEVRRWTTIQLRQNECLHSVEDTASIRYPEHRQHCSTGFISDTRDLGGRLGHLLTAPQDATLLMVTRGMVNDGQQRGTTHTTLGSLCAALATPCGQSITSIGHLYPYISLDHTHLVVSSPLAINNPRNWGDSWPSGGDS